MVLEKVWFAVKRNVCKQILLQTLFSKIATVKNSFVRKSRVICRSRVNDNTFFMEIIVEVRLKSIALKISNKVKISTIAVAQTTRKSFFAIRKNHCSFFRVLLLLVKTYNALIGVRVLYIYMLFTRWEVWRENYFPEVSKKPVAAG